MIGRNGPPGDRGANGPTVGSVVIHSTAYIFISLVLFDRDLVVAVETLVILDQLVNRYVEYLISSALQTIAGWRSEDNKRRSPEFFPQNNHCLLKPLGENPGCLVSETKNAYKSRKSFLLNFWGKSILYFYVYVCLDSPCDLIG